MKRLALRFSNYLKFQKKWPTVKPDVGTIPFTISERLAALYFSDIISPETRAITVMNNERQIELYYADICPHMPDEIPTFVSPEIFV